MTRPMFTETGEGSQNGTGPETVEESGDKASGEGSAPDSSTASQRSRLVAYPAPMTSEARYGLIGEIVGAIEPHTEADPQALLLQLLVALGNVIGRGAGFQAEADFHSTALYMVIVGESSKGRKGTSLGHVKKIIAAADGLYPVNNVDAGMATGEGLVFRVRDEVQKWDPKKQVYVMEDPGVEDKRLLVVEPEFAQVLKVMSRAGNTLSTRIRSLWDDGSGRGMTKSDPTRCTNAHVSIIGHIVRDEIRRELTATEMGNGFGNRFLFVCAKRARKLPEGGLLDSAVMAALGKKTAEAVREAKSEWSGPLVRDEAARALWHEVYGPLTEGGSTLVDAVTGRAEAQVMRIACIYAALDGEHAHVRLVHLQAALAVWRYCEDSARYIFGDALGDTVADAILSALRSAGTKGLTRTEISGVLGRNQDATRLEIALALLESNGLASRVKQKTTGRPIERWFSC